MTTVKKWFIVELERFRLMNDYINEPVIYVDFNTKTVVTDFGVYNLTDVDEEFALTTNFSNLQKKINDQIFTVSNNRVKRISY
jgi:hypothetical protein